MDTVRDMPSWDEQFFLTGWQRWLPTSAFLLCMAVKDMEEHDRTGLIDLQPPDVVTSVVLRVLGGLDAPVEFGGSVEEPEGLDYPALLRRLAGKPEADVRTNDDLLELLVALGLVIRSPSGGELTWKLANPLPLPEEVIWLSIEERRTEDRLRWEALFVQGAQLLLPELLAPGPRITTLGDLACAIDMDPETVRQALIVLLRHRTVDAVAEIEQIPEDAPLHIQIDPPVHA